MTLPLMPWKEMLPVDQREKFIRDVRLGVFSISELCERYGVSRKTGYKWLARFEEEGRAGLKDKSRAPKTCPHRLDGVVARTICDLRRKHPTWGPRKILQYMEPRYPQLILPAPSTAGDLLKRRGLVKKRRGRRKHLHPGVVPANTRGPNDIWAALDIKFEAQRFLTFMKTLLGCSIPQPFAGTAVQSVRQCVAHRLRKVRLAGSLRQVLPQ